MVKSVKIKQLIAVLCVAVALMSCKKEHTSAETSNKAEEEVTSRLSVEGTWKLIYGEIKEKDSVEVKDLSNTDFIKIINKDHFAFFNQNKETSEGFYGGGGSYRLEGDTYTEKLEYVAVDAVRNHEFPFKVKIVGDTLIQSGREEVKEAGIQRDIIEKYIRIQ